MALLAKLLASPVLKAAWNLIKKYINTTERVLLLIAIIVALVFIKLYNIERGNREMGEIATKGLPPNILSQYVLENRRLTQAVRDAEGKTRVITRYVPVEGNVKVITKKNDEAVAKYQGLLKKLEITDDPKAIEAILKKLKLLEEEIKKPPEIIIKDKGFTSRFGYGIVITPGASMKFERDGRSIDLPLVPALDWKYGFWKRYSSIVQVNPLYLGPGFTRHVDDFTPRWLHIENSEVGISGGPLFGEGWPLSSGWQAGITMRTNF